MQKREWENLKRKLARSRFRSGFRLNEKDRSYFSSKSEAVIRRHAEDFVNTRLAPAVPKNDGKQTPMCGHPVFTAQHATATCCRNCLMRWHGIPRGRKLTDDEVNFVVDIIMRWLGGGCV